MSHDDRPIMNPLPKHTFREVFGWIISLPNHSVNLSLPSNVPFTASAKTTRDGRDFIVCTGENRIYECCWGNYNNHMGKDGQRIGHFTATLDASCP